jgi:hypothetical protein
MTQMLRYEIKGASAYGILIGIYKGVSNKDKNLLAILLEGRKL